MCSLAGPAALALVRPAVGVSGDAVRTLSPYLAPVSSDLIREHGRLVHVLHLLGPPVHDLHQRVAVGARHALLAAVVPWRPGVEALRRRGQLPRGGRRVLPRLQRARVVVLVQVRAGLHGHDHGVLEVVVSQGVLLLCCVVAGRDAAAALGVDRLFSQQSVLRAHSRAAPSEIHSKNAGAHRHCTGSRLTDEN